MIHMNLSNSVCLVTGAGKRVGRSIALHFARKGALVIVHYCHSQGEARATAQECGEYYGREGLPLYADLADPNEIEDLAKSALAAYGRVDVLVNCAGIFAKKSLLETTLSEWDHFMNVNLRSAAWLSRALAPSMQEMQQGVIINIADSLAVEMPRAGYAPYSVSKAGLVALTQCMAQELAPHIRVNAVSPGVVATRPGNDADRAFAEKVSVVKHVGLPDDVAAACGFVVENDYVNGAIIPVDGGRTW
jgi:pteridine reductase